MSDDAFRDGRFATVLFNSRVRIVSCQVTSLEFLAWRESYARPRVFLVMSEYRQLMATWVPETYPASFSDLDQMSLEAVPAHAVSLSDSSRSSYSLLGVFFRNIIWVFYFSQYSLLAREAEVPDVWKGRESPRSAWTKRSELGHA